MQLVEFPADGNAGHGLRVVFATVWGLLAVEVDLAADVEGQSVDRLAPGVALELAVGTVRGLVLRRVKPRQVERLSRAVSGIRRGRFRWRLDRGEKQDEEGDEPRVHQ